MVERVPLTRRRVNGTRCGTTQNHWTGGELAGLGRNPDPVLDGYSVLEDGITSRGFSAQAALEGLSARIRNLVLYL